MLLTLLFFAAVATSPRLSLAAEEKEDMDTSESKSYGFGYGTKVADKYSVATGRRKAQSALTDTSCTH